jgi:hypothetical protein
MLGRTYLQVNARVAPHLPATLKDEVLKEAVTVAKTAKWHRRNANVLAKLTEQLAGPLQEDLLTGRSGPRGSAVS